jgi:hypothetical protein
VRQLGGRLLPKDKDKEVDTSMTHLLVSPGE